MSPLRSASRAVRGLFASAGSFLLRPFYEGAAKGRRVNDFMPANVGVNQALLMSLPLMRARVRDLMRSNPLVWRAIRAYVANLIGTGITPQPLVADKTQREQMSELWSDWTEEADATGRTDFYGIQAQVAEGFLLSGEVFVRLRKRLPEDNLSVPLQLQVLEAEHCPLDLTRTEPNGNQTKCGIEFNAIGKRVAYWLYPEHPHDQIGAVAASPLPVRVPADQVLHVYEQVRPGQLRGEPRLARVILTAFHLNQFDDATLEKAKMSAAVTAFIKKSSNGDNGPLLSPTATANSAGAASFQIKTGTAVELNDGEEMQFPPAADLGSYAEFRRENVRTLAVGTGSTYEHTSGDYEGVTYSSLREEKNQQERECEQVIYATLVPQFCRPVRALWLQQAMLAQALPAIPAREYAATPRKFLRTNWVYPGLGNADPLKEALAWKEKIKAGASSVSAWIRADGLDPEKVMAERQADFALLGDTTDLNQAHAKAATAAPAVQPDEPPRQRRRAA